MAGEIVLALGGARSGKSRWAEALATEVPAPWTYLATAEAGDAEMRQRIQRHQADRVPGWVTVEAPLELAPALAPLAGPGQTVLVDCLTLWLSNLMGAGRDTVAATDALIAALDGAAGRVILVSNEVGLGIVPDNPLARAFRDEAGRLHQRVARRATRVVLVVAGLAMPVKG